MKKLIIGLFALVLLFVGTQAHASLYSDALLKIENLKKEVLQLKDQLGSAVYSSRYNNYLGGTSSSPTSGSTTVDCQFGEIFSYSTGQKCPKAPVVPSTPFIPSTPVIPSTPFIPSTPTITPSITVLSPNGGEVYQAGQQITVKWKGPNVVGDNVFIGMQGRAGFNMNDAFRKMTDVQVPNTGSAVYTLPDASLFYPSGGLIYNKPVYYIAVYTANGIQDVSDDWFTIKSATVVDTGCQSGAKFSYTTGQVCPKSVTPTNTIPSITVLSPNGGEVYYLGESNTYLEKIKIVSSKIGTFSTYLVENPSINDTGFKYFMGSQGQLNAAFNKPEDYIASSVGGFTSGLIKAGQYYVMAEWKSNDGLENLVDFSDNYFTIKPALTIDTGCQSGAKFSYTTGAKCPETTVIDTGCQSGEIYSSTTGKKCGFTPVDTGCLSGALYSNKTGKACFH